MLVACQLAGLSVLAAYYAGVRWPAQSEVSPVLQLRRGPLSKGGSAAAREPRQADHQLVATSGIVFSHSLRRGTFWPAMTRSASLKISRR